MCRCCMTSLMTDRIRSNATLRLGSVAAVEAAKKLQPEKESPAEAGQGYILEVQMKLFELTRKSRLF